MFLNRKTALAAVLSIASVHGANASDASHDAGASGNKLEFTANVTLITDYDFRGISQSDGGPAIQGGFDATYGIFYAGTWASSVDFGDDTTMEIDFYGGIAPHVGDTHFDLGVIAYIYPDSPELPTGTQNYVEFYAGVAQQFGPFEPSAKVYYSPDFYGETGGAFYVQGEVELEIVEHLHAAAGIGASMFEDDILNDDYIDYHFALGTELEGFELELGYHATENLAHDHEAVIFSISRSF